MMTRVRLIPALLMKQGQLVRSTSFGAHRVIGSPTLQVRRFNEWLIDELLYIDISRAFRANSQRQDARVPSSSSLEEIQRAVADEARVPLVWGGGIRSRDSAEQAFAMGIDKVCVTTALFEDPGLIAWIADQFGSQAVSVGVDYRVMGPTRVTFVDGGLRAQPEPWLDVLRRAVDLGAGEVLLHAIDRDGLEVGYDLPGISLAADMVSVPIVALGGARTPAHLAEGAEAGAAGVAAANMWHFSDLVDRGARHALAEAGFKVRAP